MAYLKKHDYVPVTVTRYARAMAGEMSGFPDRAVVLTFDDGFADFCLRIRLLQCSGATDGVGCWVYIRLCYQICAEFSR